MLNKIYAYLGLSVLTLSCINFSTNINVIAQESDVPTEEVKVYEINTTENNLVKTDQKISVSGEQKGDHLYFSTDILLKENVDYKNSLVVVSRNFKSLPGAKIENNLYLSTFNLSGDKGEIVIDGINIKNGTYIFATGSNVTIKNSTFGYNTTINAENITLENNTFNGKVTYSAGNFTETNNNFTQGLENTKDSEQKSIVDSEMVKQFEAGLAAFRILGDIWFNGLWVLIGLIISVIYLKRRGKLENTRINFNENYVLDLMVGVSVIFGSLIALGVFGLLSGLLLIVPLLSFVFLVFALATITQPYTYIYIANIFKNSILKNLKFIHILIISFPIFWLLFKLNSITWSIMCLFFMLPAFGKLMRNLYFAVREYIN